MQQGRVRGDGEGVDGRATSRAAGIGRAPQCHAAANRGGQQPGKQGTPQDRVDGGEETLRPTVEKGAAFSQLRLLLFTGFQPLTP